MPRTTFLNRRRAPDHGHSTVQGCFPGRSGDMSCETARVNAIGPGSPRDHTAVVSRLVDAGSTDDRMLAALLWVSRQTRSGSEADRSGRPHTVTTLERRDSWSGSNALAGGARLLWGGNSTNGVSERCIQLQERSERSAALCDRSTKAPRILLRAPGINRTSARGLGIRLSTIR
jgi:hypothetical protein